MKAVIMAGGEGVRLRPLTCTVPKPMVPIGGKPVIEHIVSLLKKHGITQIAVTLKYLPGTIRNYLGDGKALGVQLEYFTEDRPLGTAGSVAACKGFLSPDEDFLVMSGDSLTDVDLTEAIRFHEQHGSKATLVLSHSEHPMDYGVALTDKNGAIKGFLEKPDCHHLMGDLVNTGIYILNPSLLKFCSPHAACDFAKDLFPAAMKAGVSFWGYVTDAYWCDIGKPEAYLAANTFYLENHPSADPSAILEDGVKINEPVYIGAGAYIGAGSEIGPNVSLGEGCILGRNVRVRNSILWDSCSIRSGGTVCESIICSGTETGRNAVVSQAVLGEGCRTGDYSYLSDGSRIWPNISIDEEATVRGATYTAEDRAGSSFSEQWPRGWRYLCRTPLNAAAFGWVYGQMLGVGSVVCLSEKRHGRALSAMYGLISGLVAAGITVKKVENATLPLLRWMGRTGLCDGAVMLYPEDGSVYVSVTDRHGNEPDGNFRKKFRQKLEQSGAIVCTDVTGKVEEMLNPEEFYTADIASHFPEAYKNISFGGRHFTRKEQEGLIAEIVAEFYPESPLFVSAASELPARKIGEERGLSVHICGGLPGDVMAAMEPYMEDEGVRIQYLMLFDDFAFDLGLAHFRGMGMEDSLTAVRRFPGVYSAGRTVKCGSRHKAGLMGYFASLPEFQGREDFTDGLCVRDARSTIRLCPEESKAVFQIYVESLDSEFAQDMSDRLECLADHWLREKE